MTTFFRALVLSLCLWTVAAHAAPEAEPLKLESAEMLFKAWEADAVAVDASLGDGWQGDAEDESRRAAIERHRADSRILSDKAKAAIAPLEEQIDALGPAPGEGETENESIAAERAELQKKIEALRATASKAELSFTRSDRLLSKIAEARRQKFTDRLMTRGPTPLDPANWATAGESVLSTSAKVVTEAVDASRDASRGEVWRESGPVAFAALLFALVLVVVARRAALTSLYNILGERRPQSAKKSADGATNGIDISTLPTPVESDTRARSRATRLFVGIGVTVTRLATPLVALFAARFALIRLQIFGETGEVVLNGLTVGAGIIAIAYAIVYAFFAPSEPRLRLSLADDDMAKSAARYSMLIALTMALNVAFVGVGERLGWPPGALAVVNACIIIGGSIALWRLARVTAKVDAITTEPVGEDGPTEDSEMWLSLGAGRVVRRVAYAVAVAAPLLAIAGYFALSRFVFYNTLLTGAVIAAGVLLFSVAREGTSALSEATRDRKGESDTDEEDKKGGLLPVFVGFLLILGAMPILALIWGATRDDLGEAYFALTNGFQIGDSTFRPGDLLIAAFVFGAGLFITRIVQAIMRRTVMPRTRLDTGARSSIVSGLGYFGFFVSALVAISAGGLDLTNLAFLGAALGVGIGFGLQNIVNNFVSGIILLIERPIKIGDWIEVAGTHGVVEKVNVRSTEIKTFDKASYIVPNSELISGAVTNMTHGDLMGRVIAPVGVAYGTDTRKVEKILLEILRAHPMVLRRPAPQVIFKGFGADSLDFEARGFLRDVNWILSTHSDLNFEIDRRFREENVEIPFKQTDVNIKNVSSLIEALKVKAEADAGSDMEAKPKTRRTSSKPAEGTMGDGDGDY